MENKTADFNGTTIRYITFGNDGNDLLLNTEDVCKVLGITEHREGTDMALQDMDLGQRGVYAVKYDNVEFFEWLQEEFAGYSLEVLLRSQ